MKRWLLGAVLLTSAMIAAGPALAIQTCGPGPTNWTGGGDGTSWNDPNNWDNGVPGGACATNVNSQDGVTVVVPSGYVSSQLGLVTVEGGMTVNVASGGTLNDDIIIGDTSTGTFTNNGTHNVTGDLILGNQLTGNGTYTITGNSAQTNITFSNTAETPNGALIIGNAGTGAFNQGTDSTDNGNQVNVAGAVVLGSQSGSTGSYNLNSGTLTIQTGNGGTGTAGTGIPGFFTVGDAGVGTFTQTGGAVIAGQAAGDGYAGNANQLFNMYIGNQANTAGSGGSTAPSSYSLTSSDQVSNPASLTVNGNLNLGVGTGAIGNMTIGTFAASPDPTSLTVNLDPWNNGQHSTPQYGGNILVGVNGTSTVTQNNGNVTAANDIAIGVQTGSSGTYTQFGGTVTTTTLEVGGSEIFTNPGGGGLGIFTQTGGLTTIGGWYGGQVLANGTTVPGAPNGPGVLGTLIVGAQNSIALYELGTGAGLQTNTTTWGGYSDTPGTAPPPFDNVNNAPYLQIYGNAIIGAESSAATFLLAGDGSHLQINNVVGMSNQGTMVIGLNDGANGTFTQTEQSSVYLDGSVAIGVNDGATGTYNLSAGATSGGSLSVGGDLEIGGTDHVGDPIAQTPGSFGGSGTFTQSAGSVSVQGNLDMGTNGDGKGSSTRANGTYNLSGGTLTVNNVGRFGNNGGIGTFNQTGGTAQFGTDTNSGGLQLGTTPLSGPASTGTYNISTTDPSNPATLQVYGNVDLGVATNTTGNMTIGTAGAGSDPTAVTISSTGNGDGNLTVGDAGTGNLAIHSGTLSVDSTTQVGVNGVGTITQDGGTFNTGFLDLSVPLGTGSSTYNMSGGALNVTADLNVAGTLGGTGSAVFNQSGTTNGGSTVTVGGTLFINRNGSNPGQYNISGPSAGPKTVSLTVDNVLQIGGNGGGKFNQTGGLVNIGTDTTASGPVGTQELQLGLNTGDNGSYTISNGILNVYGNADFGNSAIEVGSSGTGLFTQTGGTVNTYGANGFAVGDCCGGSGEYDISGGALNVLANPSTSGQSGNAFVGAHSTGIMTQSGDATVAINGDLNVGYQANGTYTLGGTGSLTIGAGGSGDLNIGTLKDPINGTGNGIFNYNTVTGDKATLNFAGTNQMLVVGDAGVGVFNEGSATNTTDLNLRTSGTRLDIGRSVGGNGTFNLAAGSSLEDDVIVGDAGIGTMNNTGGTHTVGTTGSPQSLILGNQSTGNGTYNLTTGGTLTVTSFTTVGNAGTGTFLNDASTHTTGGLVLATQGGSTGGYTLQDGGSLSVSGFFDVGEHGTGTFNQSGAASTATVAGALDLGRCGAPTLCLGPGDTSTAAGTGTVNLSGGSLSVGTFAVVGDAGTGTFNQVGSSTVTVGTELDIGRFGGTGTYNLGGGIAALSISDNPADASSLTITGGPLVVGGFGPNGSGTFNQTDATKVTVNNGSVDIGFTNGVTGTYNLSGSASLTTSILYVGLAGIGNFNQGGTSTVSATDFVTIGNSTGGSGTYKLSGTGTLTDSGALYVGASGTGDLQQSGGTITAAGLVLGNNSGGHGSYELSGGQVTINGTTYLGGDTSTSGTVVQTGGTAQLKGNVILGNDAASEGQYSLLGTGALTIGGNLDIAAAAGTISEPASSGSFYFNYNVVTSTPGGSATLAFSTPSSKLIVGDAGTGVFWQGGGDLNLKAQNVTLKIGAQSGSHGAYNLVGGTLEDDLIVGDAGSGAFNNTGGTHTVSGNLVVGNQSTGIGTYALGGTGNLTLSDANAQIILGNAAGSNGTFNYNTSPSDAGTITFGSTGQSIIVGNNGNGVLNQAGGDLNLSGSGVNLEIAANTGSFGQVNLSGGTLETGSLNVGDAGEGQFNMSGGSATVNGNLVAGNQTGSSGNIVVGGAGAPSLTVTGDFTIGNNGFGNYLQSAGATVDIKGSMTVASNGAAIEGGSLTVGDGGAGHQLLIVSGSGMKIEDTGGLTPAGAQVTVDGTMTNNGQLELGLHDATPPATLTVTQGLTNNGAVNFEGNAVINADVTNNSGAFFRAQNGATTNVTLNGNMSNSGTVNVAELGHAPSTFTQNGTFTNNASGTFTVTDGVVTITGQSGSDSLDNTGTVTFSNDPNIGTTPPFQPSTVALNGNVTNSGGTINVQGSNVTVNGSGNTSPALDNAGTLAVGTGFNSRGSTLTVNGASNMVALLNEVGASLSLTNSSITVNGATTNNGTMTVSGGSAHWNGTFTNNGGYISDPMASYFIDLNIGSKGYLQGGSGDLFDVSGNFTNNSTDTNDWNTSLAELEFSGNGTTHNVQSGTTDLGPTSIGNFSWGSLEIDSNNILDLLNALYVGALDYNGTGFTPSDLFSLSGDFNLYYDPSLNPALADQAYAFAGGGDLCPIGAANCVPSTLPPPTVPEPNSLVLLISGLGVVIFFFHRRRMTAAGYSLGGAAEPMGRTAFGKAFLRWGVIIGRPCRPNRRA
jgi:hypothetical protein